MMMFALYDATTARPFIIQFSCVCGPVYYFANPINYGKKTVVFLISRIGCYKVDFILWLLKNRLAIP